MQGDLIRLLLLVAVIVPWVGRHGRDIDRVGDCPIEQVLAGRRVIGPHVCFFRLAIRDDPDEGRLLCDNLYDLALPL